MSDLSRMPDTDLIAARDHALKMAQEAPGNLFRNADGSASIGNSDAWARWSREWMRLADEVDRRSGGNGEPAGLKPLISNGEGEPDREAGLSAGSPLPPPLHAIVPRDPTPAMLQACRGALYRYITTLPDEERSKNGAGGYRVPWKLKATLRWRAMLDAAAVSPGERRE